MGTSSKIFFDEYWLFGDQKKFNDTHAKDFLGEKK
jgi:hypothetical protein